MQSDNDEQEFNEKMNGLEDTPANKKHNKKHKKEKKKKSKKEKKDKKSSKLDGGSKMSSENEDDGTFKRAYDDALTAQGFIVGDRKVRVGILLLCEFMFSIRCLGD